MEDKGTNLDKHVEAFRFQWGSQYGKEKSLNFLDLEKRGIGNLERPPTTNTFKATDMQKNEDFSCAAASLRHAGDAVAALLGGWVVGYGLRGRCSLLLLLDGGSLMADAGWTLLESGDARCCWLAAARTVRRQRGDTVTVSEILSGCSLALLTKSQIMVLTI
ncbi:hypothetical protein WN944_011602 [Citrus x changshan-huyou]|uniref:Uncharacterized protein n=1 Tax=Citrus x changshan-huyou TaxID=2935761 RepID=A0AAP0MWC0_9ROSI